ncbi:glycosyltransferase family 4 protein [Methanolobus halotolerans]|uniref:Glycosyl transferase family 1 n=1 Tax=Methanolobus halotolerans TaxID=2052935 RepID=A0A4E0Q8B4_9EURY|nr:glycosyltransferase family 4 protein [Methanolobus halotolerans]TGC08022.1 glycosyl transferase family 1 [Methanolobus halotolerans]
MDNAKNKNKVKIAYIYYSLQFFVKQDRDLLSKHFTVYELNFKSMFDLFKLILVISKSDITYSWFAGGHAFLAVILSKIFRKKSIVIAGGGDVAYLPEIDYGAMRKYQRSRFFSNFVLKYADVVLAVSNFTKEEVLRWQKPNKMEVIYNGIDTKKKQCVHKKENMVVTIANRYKLKGIKTFVEASAHFPNLVFVVIGSAGYDIKNPPTNVIVTGNIINDEVINWLSKSKVYCQLSYYESFGMGLAEAMACGCIPVATNRAALPEVVGDAGILVPYDDTSAAVEAIKKALNMDGNHARKRVITKFELGKRESRLVDIITFLMRKSTEPTV